MRQKINKDIKDSNSDLEQVNLIFIELSTSNTQNIHSCQYHITHTHRFKWNIDWPLLIPIFFFQNKAIFPFTLPLSLPLSFSPLLIYFSFSQKKKSTCKPLDPGPQCLSHCSISFLPFSPSLPPFLTPSLPFSFPPFLKNKNK